MTPELIELYKAIQGRIRGLEADDEVFCPRCKYRGRAGGHWVKSSCRGDNLLWLPPVWSEDGRCLISMIECDFTVTRIWYDSDDLTTDDGWIYGVDIHEDDFYGYYNTLPEALLRAIGEQEADHD